MTDDEIRTFVANHEWTFAKTMPGIPHWYTLRRKAKRDEDFTAFVQQIRFRGVQRQFGGKSFTYLDIDGWTYWTMGAPIEETILINRARLPGNETPPGSFRLGSGSESSSRSGSSFSSPSPSAGRIRCEASHAEDNATGAVNRSALRPPSP